MNRHARRAAAARARSRRTGYLHRIAAAMRTGTLPATVGAHHCAIEHDSGYAIYRGAGCDCVPDISVSGPDGVVVIDEDGEARKVATQ